MELPQVLAGSDVKLGVHTLDAPGVPFLISVGTLQKLKAVIDVDAGYVCFKAVAADHWIPLVRGPNGHLLLDLTEDWFHGKTSEACVTLHDLDRPSRVQYKAEECAGDGMHESSSVLVSFQEVDKDSDCELMTDQQHSVHSRPHARVFRGTQ